ncbi:signal peptidase II [Xylocopilactobacillus apicola]|uniref:Lipoprotein signal peptidase n=1 Tax=Xylocopilactobacillus apicola TaxID=2932184 RepID=A0AAU9DJG0_9LACO|nr:signal peptidase II [Xylocopilactobacillus apicola]BDR58606.1 lipoprotein signal peptidase [Xylocopilactobacillus apicola]
MSKKVKILIISLIVILDQFLKFSVKTNIAPENEVPLIPGFISLTNIKNSGAAWSLWEGKTWIFIIVTLIFIPFAIYFLFFKKYQDSWFNTGLALILGGTIGNFIDRIFERQVVDMIMLKFIDFPIFNLADVAINVGVVCLVIYLFKSGKDTPNE